MARRLSSPVFIGRTEELATLVATSRAAEAGRPSIVLVGGEAGVGKSRLVAEAATQLRDGGWLVLEGGSVALGDDALPFGPIVEALRALARDVDPDTVAAAAGPALPVLARLVPELSVASSDAAEAGSSTVGAQPEWLQIRIFEGLLAMLGRLGAGGRPVMLVIEDLHWADRSTRDLLAFLWRNARDERLCIVGTFRSDELHRRHPLTAWLAEAERQPRVDRLDLTRFERRELAELLTGIMGTSPAPSLLDSIARRSDGNAFFAEELVAASDPAMGNRDRLPDTLRGVLLVRLGQATEHANRLVEVAAVAGNEVGHDVLAAVCGLSGGELATGLREAVAAQLLVVDPTATAERYRFRHALVQEAAYDQLLPSERRALHAAYAEAISGTPVPGGVAAASRLVEIAHHWTAAHEPGRALPAAIAAGDASRAVFAYGEATRQFELAIELWDLCDPADRPTDRDLDGLFDAASASATLVGDASRAVDHALHALDLVDSIWSSDSDSDRERRARARERLGAAASLAGDTATSINALEEAVGLLEGTPATTVRARVLAGLAANLMLAARASESTGFAREAMEVARAIGDEGIESRAMSILGVDLATLGDIGGGIELLRGAVALASPADDPTIVPRAYTNLGSVLEMGGFVEEALEVSLAGADKTARYGSELGFLTFLEVNAAAMLIELARYPEAAELLERNVPRALPGVATIHVYTTLAHLAIRTGDLVSARRDLDLAEREAGAIDDAQFVIDLCSFATEIAHWEGDPASALAIATDGFDRLAEMDDAVLIGQLAIPAVRAAADIAVAARAARDEQGAAAAVDGARDVIDRYRASTERLTEPDDLARHEIAWRMDLCTAELSRASGDDRPENWSAVRPALVARPSPFLEAYVLWRESEARAGSGDPGGAATALREASARARAIGARLLVARIDGLARRLRIDVVPQAIADGAVDAVAAVAGPSAEPSAPTDPFGLTTREREVLALVAEGWTNRRIADELFISESTAGVHVSHILAKLNVETRTEAATVAVRLGLDRPA